MADANKRIPVTEDRLKALDELKAADETYNELLEDLVQKYERGELTGRAREVRKADSGDLTSLNEL